MRVPDEIRKCVCFVCSETDDGSVLARGTAFFLGIPRVGNEGHWVYLVTARHVLTAIKFQRPDGNFLLRLNARGGGATFVRTNVDSWHTHPDVALVDDAAVLPWAPPPDAIDYLFYPVDPVALEQQMTRMDIGVGDEVFLPGLFVHHIGRTRNIPIIRVGNIAAIPDEPVDTRIGQMPAYLIEARSIGGLSGAPVIVNASGARTIGGSLTVGSGPPFALLGLTHGHYKVDVQKLDPTSGNLDDEAINMGIAIVLPASRIFDIINSPELTKMRDKVNEQTASKTLPTMDTVDVEDSTTADLMGKLLQVPKDEADEVHRGHQEI
jgi:hypothetical protein